MGKLIQWLQRSLLWLSFGWHKVVPSRFKGRDISWVVGTQEISSMIAQLARAIPGSYSVAFSEVAFYSGKLRYDATISAPVGTRRREWIRKVWGPLLLGRLANRARGVIYVGRHGFLEAFDDGREYEMRWLKARGLKVVCYWTGSDIRSLPRMRDLEARMQLPNIATYIPAIAPSLDTSEWEQARVRFAAACDAWADAAFSNSVDHLSHLKMKTEPFLYFLPEDRLGDLSQFDDLTRPVLVHATSSPVIKGTQLVRAAIAKLRAEGYDFEYVELMGVGNDEVLRQLRRSHIALNQFYGFSPAVFGAEALCAGTVVMMSADETVETDLPRGSNDAWVVTKHYQVYDNLKALLDAPQTWRPIAERAVEWARQYATEVGAGTRLNAVLDDVAAGTYRPGGRP